VQEILQQVNAENASNKDSNMNLVISREGINGNIPVGP